MTSLIFQPAPLLFIAMSVTFFAVLLGCSITDAIRR